MDVDRSLVDLTDDQGDDESKDEFIIDKDKLQVLVGTQEKLYNSFQVTLTLGDTSSDPDYGSKQWIQIDGLPENRKAAKEYIQTLCSPIEVQPMRYPKELESVLTNPDVHGPVEKHSRAVIRFEQPGEVMIYGDDRVAVTLAYSALEDIISQHLEDADFDLETTFPKERGKQASHRLTEELKRRLSTEDRASVSDVDNMNNAIKRAILDVLDYGKGDGEDDLETFGIVPHEPKKKATLHEKVSGTTQPMEDGPSLGEAAMQLKHIQINAVQPAEETSDVSVAVQKQSSVTEKGKYQKEWALSKGFSKEKIDMVFQEHGYDLQFQEFYRVLNNIGSTDAAPVSAKSGTVDGSGVSSTKNSKQSNSTITVPAESTDPTTQQVETDQQLPSRQVVSYIARLSRDHMEEDDVESIDELKQRNAQRQRLLMRIFEKRKDNLEANNDEDVTVKGSMGDIDEISLDEIDARPRHHQDSFRQTEGQGHNSRHQSHAQYHHQQTHHPSQQHETGRSRSPLRAYQGSHQNFMQGRSPSPKRYRDSRNFPSPKHQGQPGQPKHQGQHGQPGHQGQHGQPGHVGTSQDSAQGVSYPKTNPAKFGKRYVVIDGSNVAFCHGNGKIFSCRGIQLCIDYFLKRGHTEITAFVPQWRTRSLNKDYPISDQHLLDDLKTSGHLVFTPSRRVPGKNIVCYDDRYVLRLAQETEGVIVSNDNYRDLWQEKPEWRRIIEDRLLMFSFVADIFMPPDDPLGKNGPQLDEFLQKGSNRSAQNNMNFSSGSGPAPLIPHYQPPQQYRHQQPQAQHRAWAPRPNYAPPQPLSGQRPHHPRNQVPRSQGQTMAYNKDPKAHGANATHQNQNIRPRNNRPLQVDSVDSATSWQSVSGKKPQQTHVQGKKKKRDPKVTRELETGLKSVFADNDDAIMKILSENPAETDLNTLSEYLLNYMGT